MMGLCVWRGPIYHEEEEVHQAHEAFFDDPGNLREPGVL
jgi:hypothetical protein